MTTSLLEGNFELRIIKLCLKIDLLLHSAHAEGLANIYIYIMFYTYNTTTHVHLQIYTYMRKHH